jgi:acylglycerol lipase
VSRDQEALKVKYSDPLVFTGSIRVRTGYEILRLTSYLQQHLHRITVPLLVLHGADDMVTDPAGSKSLHREASTPDKSIRLYDGLLHDLLIEPEKEVVLGDIVDWLRPRI